MESKLAIAGHHERHILINFAIMTIPEPILECIPNISEGKDLSKIQELKGLIEAQPGVFLLHQDSSPSAHRTVFTFAGRPQAVCEAAFQLIRRAGELIDMRVHRGIHPRLGATDVCPIVPLGSMTMDQAVHLSIQLGERVGSEAQIPVYLYEHSATKPYRKTLPQIRKGEYEGLEMRQHDPQWAPDFGPALKGGMKSGATVLGARDLLIAFNLTLDTEDVSVARYLATRLRTSGYWEATEKGRVQRPGLFPKLRAIGWYQGDIGKAQVSMNFLDYRQTSPWQVWQTCKKMAEEKGVALLGSELVGLLPKVALLEAGKADAPEGEDKSEAYWLEAGVRNLRLDYFKPFNIQERILELNLLDKGIII